MVTDSKSLLALLKNPTAINKEQLQAVNDLINQYPYFQPSYVLKTIYLKNNKLPYQSVLQQTAARTIDRRNLFEIIEISSKKTDKFKETKTDKNEKIEIQPVKKTKSSKPEVPINKTKLTPQTDTTIKKTEKAKASKKEAVKLSYLEWLSQFKYPQQPKKEDDIFETIDKFLKDKPKLVPKKNSIVETPKIVEKSIEEKQMLMTETLANLYVKQKKYDKAIQAFRILSLKYPKKSSYFANQIKELKKLK
jgi:tetratricopeptide (TPR) repeat protein